MHGKTNRFDVTLIGSAFIAVCAVAYYLDRSRNGGTFSYIIDDPYIHMAVAKNLTKHGMWGVTSNTFSSASSSPLWVLLLCPGFLFPAWANGLQVHLPLFLNLLFAICSLYLCHGWLRMASLPRVAHNSVLIAIVVFAPMLTLVFIGMEHCLHLFLWLAFLGLATSLLNLEKDSLDSPAARRRLLYEVVAIGAVMSLVRIEGLFALSAVALLLLLRRRMLDAIMLGLAAVPLVAFSVWSLSQGGGFLPNSLLMKGKIPQWKPGSLLFFLTSSIYEEFAKTTDLLILFLLVALGAIATKKEGSGARTRVAAWLWTMTAVLHLQFARTGWYFRYEAYLVVSGMLLVAVLWSPILSNFFQHRWPTRPWRFKEGAILVTAAVFALAQPFLRKGFTIPRKTPSLAADAFHGNWQVGRFLAAQYPGRAVALNDIGAPTYLADFDLVDLWGLGTLDVTRAVRQNRFNTAWAEDYCRRHGVEIAVLNSSFLSGILLKAPESWRLVRRWRIETVDGQNTLHFFATTENLAEELKQRLISFEPSLPAGTRPM
jgi:hypothetical protein